MPVPKIRIRAVNDRQIKPEGSYVLYWMTSARRTAYNYGLERAADMCRQLDKPLVVLEALRVDYPYASDRLHAFILQGMADNQEAFKDKGVRYHPFVERAPGEGKGLLQAMAAEACLVVTDQFPAFFLPRMVDAAGAKLNVRLEAVDSCGLLPMCAGGHEYKTAQSFRRILQRLLPVHLAEPPQADPLAAELPGKARLAGEITQRWTPATPALLAASPQALAGLPMDHEVAPSPIPGGPVAAGKCLARFVEDGRLRYADGCRHPDANATSGLSPYLHFGHISPHQAFTEVAEAEGWSPDRLGSGAQGRREGWWGMSPGAEAFLDQLVTWRELGYNFCKYRPDYDRYASLPEWAVETLHQHAEDERSYVYGREILRRAQTHDTLWNAAQRQLLREGVIQNYLRMLWGKNILAWSSSPKLALAAMLELNDRYALDGRDPNSISGIFWVLGRFDHPWPERPVFGKVRYMTSANTRRKLRLKEYLERYKGKGEA
ncbi:MAG: deoxyribodipyrimidine photolyase [Desulfarculus sp.]|nr:deoxyribodipyrimidine photolyase [Pseudomonadota bacterium]MBV1716517.1 deoxyribodipyrimidine photolyase [Desulfarculus sp.]MBU4575765.1 deoxyribodipyrimidine photolyase [Pseudomonadota bacterium]MBU4599592.1 deoxyribodipyrimidine photolyase [Pseudomonadota bacterium]MBV1738718.1 deoxyribodipyrimidine photolyase [Desulfarculus sp.]